MTLEFRDHQILVIAPGSSLTQAQMGLSESLMPPAYEVPTVVYQNPHTGRFSMSPGPESTEIRPVVQGRIAHEPALHYLLKMVYRSVTPLDGLTPALYLVASLGWTRRQVERAARYLFEEVGIPAVAVALQGVATAYAFAANDALVIDVGLDKTEITAVTGLEAQRRASAVVPVGGTSINQELAIKLPQLSPDQIEDLKTSPIYEVVGADHSHVAPAEPGAAEEEDGVVDIAAIVVSGRAREILAKREKQKQAGDAAAEETNADREQNVFTDRTGQQITVGLERFIGTERLVNAIVDAVADVLYYLEPRDQQRVFDNIIFTGRGSTVAGLRQLIADKLDARYVIRPRAATATTTIGGTNPPMALGTPGAGEEADGPTQSPTSLSVARLPDHFPEWKNRRWEDYMFLGAQIGAKQVLTTGAEGMFVSRQDYNEVGPSSVWDTFN